MENSSKFSLHKMKVKITHLIKLNNTIYDKLETSLRKGILT
jgi:hypothetical protein